MESIELEKNKLIHLVNDKKGSNWISFEFFPPKTESGVKALFQTIEKLKKYNPIFIDFTWGAGGSTSDLTIDLCKHTITEHSLVPNMHLTCTGLDLTQIDNILERCQTVGIVNILALRGDPPQGLDTWIMPKNGLTSALELIKYIKNSAYSNSFCIGAAGYPEGHPNKMTVVDIKCLESLSPAEKGRVSSYSDSPDIDPTYLVCRDNDFVDEIKYLKEKVDAGATFVITQMFFDVTVFSKFLSSCRAAGINVPIIPGIMLIGSYPGFKKMTKLCKTRVPEDLQISMESLKDDDEGVKEFGIKYGFKIVTQLLELDITGLHFYTLNSSYQTSRIIDELASLGLLRISSSPLNSFS